VADSAICTGVALMFLLSWRNEEEKPVPTQTQLNLDSEELVREAQKRANPD
jgi:hypothetical protein